MNCGRELIELKIRYFLVLGDDLICQWNPIFQQQSSILIYFTMIDLIIKEDHAWLNVIQLNIKK